MKTTRRGFLAALGIAPLLPVLPRATEPTAAPARRPPDGQFAEVEIYRSDFGDVGVVPGKRIHATFVYDRENDKYVRVA